MLYCEKCRVSIRTEHKACPLCHGALTGEANPEEAVFPKISISGIGRISFVKLMTFCCVVAIILSYVINNLITNEHKWFFYVASGILFGWVVIVWGKSKSRNLLKNSIWQAGIISIGNIIFDIMTGWHGWSVDFVLPIVIIISMIFSIVISMAKRLPASDYMIYLIINVVYGFVPFILVKTGIVENNIPSVICTAFAMIIISALIIFRFRYLINELIKKFHL